MAHPNTPFLIRAIAATDHLTYLPLIQEFRDTRFTEEEFKDRLHLLTASGCHEIWVIEDPLTRRLLATGTLVVEWKFIYNLASLGHIEDVCVTASFRGQGLGQMMCRHLAERARLRGCYKVTLDCAPANEGFYTKCGFKKTGAQMVRFLDDRE